MIALSIPATLPDGRPFPERDLILAIGMGDAEQDHQSGPVESAYLGAVHRHSRGRRPLHHRSHERRVFQTAMIYRVRLGRPG